MSSSENTIKRDNSNYYDASQSNIEIPSHYGDNKIVLMVRDPWTIFSYWEINNDVEGRVRAEIAEKNLVASKSILRVYDVTDGDNGLGEKIASDFELKHWVDRWYVHTGRDGKKWMVEIGILCENGEFFGLAKSNIVATPSYGMSDKYDEKWMCPEDLFYKMFAIAGGQGIGMSSLSAKEMVERHVKEWLSAGGVTSGMFGSASLFQNKRK